MQIYYWGIKLAGIKLRPSKLGFRADFSSKETARHGFKIDGWGVGGG